MSVRILVTVALVVAAAKLLVWWIEPWMAFFPIRGIQETPRTAGFAYTDIRIPTTDGERLHAWWLEHPQPRAQVIFWHGNGGNLSMWLDVIAELRRRGASVLAVDYRGYGDSTGKASERGLYTDADATVRMFAESLRRPGTPVIYWGRSIGSAIAAYAASKAPPDALVLETPFPEVRSILRTNPVLWVLSFLSSYRFATSKHLGAYHGPLLVIHGDADTIIPFSAGRRVFERASSARKTFVSIPGADHNDLHVVNPQAYWRSIDEFVGSLPRRP